MQPDQLGPYRIVGRLGRGGMGTVYQGVNVDSDEPAAVKVLARELGQEEDFRHRFASEIETLRRLNHPNIVRLFGFGEQDDQLFYAMELVDGISLEEEINRGRRFEWREVSRIGVEICRALRHAHDRGVIHRDIKPANILLAADGSTKLSDFGIARLFGSTRVTTAGSVIGTVEYMAPEQADGRPIDHRADLYSLAGVMYALLAGRPPFVAKTLHEMLHKQRSVVPDPVNSFVKGLPDELSEIIEKLLAKKPSDRIPNALVLGRRLDSLLSMGTTRAAPSESEAEPDVESSGDKSHESSDGENKYEDVGFELTPPARMPEGNDPAALAVTRDIGDSDPSLYLADGAPADESLPETRATDAFGAFAAVESPQGKAPVPPAPDEKTNKDLQRTEYLQKTVNKGRFTAVPHEELDRVVPRVAERHALISAQTWVLAAALIIIGMGAWYALRPPSADALYEKITAKTADGTIASIESAKDDIKKFLLNHADDPRCQSLQEFEREIRLASLSRRFKHRLKKELLPIEQAYIEADNYAWLDPEMGVKKLQALVDLYGRDSEITGPTGQCLELARRQLEKLRAEIGKSNPEHLKRINSRLELADKLITSEPEEAVAIWKAVVELYAQKPWAAAAVSRAEEAMDKAVSKPKSIAEAKTESRVGALPDEEKADTKIQ